MTKLYEHMGAMAGMVSLYLQPGPYEAQTEPGKTLAGDDRDRLIQDLIYMLDGPEQREAFREQTAMQDELDQLKMDLKEARDKCAVANSDRGRATEKLEVVKRENNELRDRLMESELSRARMTGYLARVEDNEPPRMVAQERPRFFESHDARVEMPRTDFASYRSSTDRPLNWYHR